MLHFETCTWLRVERLRLGKNGYAPLSPPHGFRCPPPAASPPPYFIFAVAYRPRRAATPHTNAVGDATTETPPSPGSTRGVDPSPGGVGVRVGPTTSRYPIVSGRGGLPARNTLEDGLENHSGGAGGDGIGGEGGGGEGGRREKEGERVKRGRRRGEGGG